MSFLGAFFRAADLVLAGAQAADRLYTAAARLVRKVRRAPSSTEPSQRLPGKDVIHIYNQSKAGAENHRLKPPPLKRRL